MPTPISIKRRVNGSTYEVLQPATTWTQVADKPATFTPTSHTHGNIQDGGTMTGSSISPGSGVNILVSGTDNVIGKSTTAFGTSTTTFLRNDGAWGSVTASVALATSSA